MPPSPPPQLPPPPPPPPQLPPQSPTPAFPKLGAGFEVLGYLGEGGMGSVYKVREEISQKIYAVKLLKSDMARDPIAVMRFEQEVKAASELTHPNLIFIHGSHRAEDGAPYMVMNYVDGESLAQSLQFLKFMPPERALPVFQQVAEALEHVHTKGIIHRDLKPSNILIYQDANRKDAVRLVDFGIAKMENVKTTNTLTQTGELFGSPLYMSPEQCASEVSDARSDIYSLGCVMYQTLCGRPPFDNANAIKTMISHMQVPPQSLRSVHNDFRISKDLEAVVMRCLSKKPVDRYQSARELLTDLEAVAAGQKVAKSSFSKVSLGNIWLATHWKQAVLIVFSFATGSICTLLWLFCFGFFQRPSQINQPPIVPLTAVAIPRRADSVLLDGSPAVVNTGDVSNETELFSVAQTGAKNIDFSGRKLTDRSLRCLINDHRLRSLEVADTGISDKALSPLIVTPVLAKLSIADNPLITDAGMETIAQIKTLHYLDASGTSVSDKGLAKIATLPDLRYLFLDKTSVSDSGFKLLTNLKELVRIDIGTTLVGDQSMKLLSNWQGLEGLNLSYDDINDAGAIYLKNVPNLLYLDMRRTKVTKQCAQIIANLNKLQSLTPPDSFDDESTLLLSKLPNLEVFTMTNEMTDLSFQYLSGHRKLRKIVVGRGVAPASPILKKFMHDNPKCKVDFPLRMGDL